MKTEEELLEEFNQAFSLLGGWAEDVFENDGNWEIYISNSIGSGISNLGFGIEISYNAPNGKQLRQKSFLGYGEPGYFVDKYAFQSHITDTVRHFREMGEK